MSIIAIPRALRDKLGEEGSDALVDVLNMQGDENKQSVIDLAEQRFEAKLAKETSLLREEMAGFDTKLKHEISILREEMIRSDLSIKEDLLKSIQTVSENVQTTRADLIKWMFIFWVGQLFAIGGILFAFYKIIN